MFARFLNGARELGRWRLAVLTLVIGAGVLLALGRVIPRTGSDRRATDNRHAGVTRGHEDD
jgi:hypothetical protein